jgi:hypothetical protein
VNFFLLFLEQLDEQIRCGCWTPLRPTIGTVQADERPIPALSFCETSERGVLQITGKGFVLQKKGKNV